jgi:apolipoprotein N-acyltransferase
MVWVVVEWLRSCFLGGFPWLTLACSQWQVPKHLPLAQLGGSYAVSFLIVLFNGTLFSALLAWGRKPGQRLAPLPGGLALLVLTVCSVRLWQRPQVVAGDPISMAIVQGNIDQYKKWDRAYVDEIMSIYSALTRDAAQHKPHLILWPETAVPGWVPNEPEPTQWVSGLARATAVPLLVGAVTRETTGDFNAAFLVSSNGHWADIYRKVHLVPFGEFVPFRRLLSPFIRVLNDLGTFDAGPSAHVISTSGARLGVTICFEGFFPRLVRRFTANGAQVLVNITNDGWYRDTAAPEQHFAPSVLRAVENRRWVVRAANTGYSGFISPRGERTAMTAPDGTGGPLWPPRAHEHDHFLFSLWRCVGWNLRSFLFRGCHRFILLKKEKESVEITPSPLL